MLTKRTAGEKVLPKLINITEHFGSTNLAQARRVYDMPLISRKVVLLLLAVIILVSISMRYPLVEHERHQTDSYYIHLLSESIIDNGFARWITHPLSLTGYYPMSYPSGVPFLLAESSILSGLTVETTILMNNVMLAIAFCLVVFLLARHFLRKPQFALLATFLGVIGARFVDTSYWNGSARGLAVFFIALVVLVLVNSYITRYRRSFALASSLM